MRFRLGFLIGLLTGYVLGAKAGRERYEQLRNLWDTVRGSTPARQIGSEVRLAANRAGDAIEQKAAQGVALVTEKVRGGGTEATEPPQPPATGASGTTDGLHHGPTGGTSA